MSILTNTISFIILTKNEDKNIYRCIHNLKKISDSIIVVDSFSDDSTVDICKNNNVLVFQNKFINQGLQFNWALDNINIPNKWIMRVDADEYLSENLINEILNIDFVNTKFKGFSMNKKIIWMGKWIKYGGIYPMHVNRIFEVGYGKYEELTEENLIINGTIKHLKNDIIDDNANNNIVFFSKKHLMTGVGELSEFFDQNRIVNEINKNIFGNKSERTRWFKTNLYNKLPLFFRCLCYFIYRYFFKLGFLDGIPGLIFHFLQGFWYRFLIDSLIYEQKNKDKTFLL